MTRRERVAADEAAQDKLFGDIQTVVHDDPELRHQGYRLNTKTRDLAVKRARAQPDDILLATYQQDPKKAACPIHVVPAGFHFTFCGLLVSHAPASRRPASFNSLQMSYCKPCLKALGVVAK